MVWSPLLRRPAVLKTHSYPEFFVHEILGLVHAYTRFFSMCFGLLSTRKQHLRSASLAKLLPGAKIFRNAVFSMCSCCFYVSVRIFCVLRLHILYTHLLSFYVEKQRCQSALRMFADSTHTHTPIYSNARDPVGPVVGGATLVVLQEVWRENFVVLFTTCWQHVLHFQVEGDIYIYIYKKQMWQNIILKYTYCTCGRGFSVFGSAGNDGDQQ